MNKFLLKILMMFSPIWKGMGVEPLHMKTIVETKLMIDNRRTNAFSQGMSAKQGKWGQIIMYIFYLIVGSFCIGILSQVNDKSSGLALYFLIWMVMLSITLISDFTDVLFDIRDNYIIIPQPVSDQTVTIARLIHVFIYLVKLTIPFALPGLIYMGATLGVGSCLLMILQIILSVILSIFLVNIFYLVMLRYISGQRFKEIINYVQILMISLIFIGYYVLPRFLDFANLSDIDLFNKIWSWFLPSTWIAALHGLLIQNNYATLYIVCSVLAIVAPFLGMLFVSKVLSKQFNQNMISLGQGGSAKEKTIKVETNKPKLMSWWSKMLLKEPVEKSAFELSWYITSRSRDFKLKTYPIFAMFPAMFIYFVFMDDDSSIGEQFHQIQGNSSYIVFIYFALLAMITPLTNSAYSSKFKSAWIFFSTPIEKPGLILRGNTIAILVKFAVPIMVCIAIIVIWIWGWHTIDDLVIGFLNTILIMGLVSRVLYKQIPFASAWSEAQKGGNMGNAFLLMFLIGILGGIHWFITTNILFSGLWLVLTILGIYLLYHNYESLRWPDFRYSDDI